MQQSFFGVLFSWSMMLLGATIAAVLYFYTKSKRRQLSPTFRVFVPLTEYMVGYRNSVIGQDIGVYLCIVFLDQNRYAIDMKMKFLIKESSHDLKYLFLDFYNFPVSYSGVLNGQKFDPRLVHGRLYLDRRLFLVGQSNVLEFSFVSNICLNPEWTKLKDSIVVNGNKRQMASFIPCFDQGYFLYNISTNIRSHFGRSLLYLAPVIKEDTNKDGAGIVYCDSSVITVNEFFLVVSKTAYNFRKHHIKLSGPSSVSLLIASSIDSQQGVSGKFVKFMTRILKSMDDFFHRLLKETYEMPNLDVILVPNDASDFSMKHTVVVSLNEERQFIEFKASLLRKLIEALMDRLNFYSDDKDHPESDIQFYRNRVAVCIEFLLTEQTRDIKKIILYYLCNYFLFFNADDPRPVESSGKQSKKRHKNNFQVYEYANYLDEVYFAQQLIAKMIESKSFRNFFAYTISFTDGKPLLKVLGDSDTSENYPHDSLFVYQDLESKKPIDKLLPLLLGQLRFSTKREFICFLHFFFHFVELKSSSVDLLTRIFKLNADLAKSKKVAAFAIKTLSTLITLAKGMTHSESFLHRLKEALHVKSFLSDKCAVAMLLAQISSEASAGFVWDRQAKFFLKNKYSFHNYYFVKHALAQEDN
jgi:hypothetical protein